VVPKYMYTCTLLALAGGAARQDDTSLSAARQGSHS
jgi:hypothetical protein